MPTLAPAHGVRAALPVLFATLLATPAAAQGGALDPSFGAGGLVTTDFGRSQDETAEATMVLPDGRILVAGTASEGSVHAMVVARLTAAGALDPTFGNGGRAVVGFPGESSFGRALAVQPDGAILVAGSAGGFAVARLTATGALDPTFGVEGRVVVDVDDRIEDGRAVSAMADGRIVVGGSMLSPGDADFTALRLTAEGALDPTFGEGGLAIVDVPPQSFSGAAAAAVDPAGRVVLAGSAGSDFAVLRLTAEGTPDVLFGTEGLVLIDVAGSSDGVEAVALDDAGRAVVAGYSYTAGFPMTAAFAAARLMPDGAPDSSFGTDGRVRVDVGAGSSTAYGVAVQSDGKVVMAGHATGGFDGGLDNFAVVRLTSAGDPDATFADDGRATLDVAAENDYARAVDLGPDERVVAVGYTNAPDEHDLVVARFAADGTPDAAFGGAGHVVLDGIGPGSDEATAVAVQPDGRLVALGAAFDGDSVRPFVARYLAGGQLDASFGEGGVARLGIPAGYSAISARAVALQPDGGIVVAGDVGSAVPYGDCFVARLTPDGALDVAFGVDGWAVVSVGNADDRCFDVAVGPEGRIVASGHGSPGSDPARDFAAFRLTAGGALDPSFDGDGRATASFSSGEDVGRAVAIHGDGRIVLTGVVPTFGGPAYAALRLTADGAPDPTFGEGGWATVGLGPSYTLYGGDVALDSDGRIVVGGSHTTNQATGGYAVARLTPDGTPDASFGGGIVAGTFGGLHDAGRAVAVQADGRILVVGSAAEDIGVSDLAVARLTEAGDRDPSFGTDGVVRVEGAEAGAAVALQPDGRIVAAGYAVPATALSDAALVRLLPGEPLAGEPAAPVPALMLWAWPNPAAGAAAVRFVLPTAQRARLAVYDVLGREVAVLADGPLAAGTHAAALDAAQLGAGVYLLRLEAYSGELVRRFTVAR